MLKSRGVAGTKSGKHGRIPSVAWIFSAMNRLATLSLLVATACALSSCAIPEGISYVAKKAHERWDTPAASAAAPAPVAPAAPAPAPVPPPARWVEEPPPPPAPTALVPRPSVKVEQLP